jgi:hypothetical protein
MYKLTVYSDDGVKLWLDDNLVLQGGTSRHDVTVELGRNAHALRIEYFEGTVAAHISLQWQPPGARDAVVIPAEALFCDREVADRASVGRSTGADRAPPPKGTGVVAEVFPGPNLQGRSVKRTVRDINWNGHEAAFVAGMPADHFSVRFTTWLVAPKPGKYRLILGSEDGHRMRLDGKVFFDDWKRGPTPNETIVEFDDKPHALAVEFFNDKGPSHVSLFWEQDGGFKQQLIPPEAFFTDKGEAIRARR